jgi:hypothetical protein
MASPNRNLRTYARLGLNSDTFKVWTRDRASGATFPKFAPEPERAKPTAPAPYIAPYPASKIREGERRAARPAAAAPLVQGNAHVPDYEIRNRIRRAKKLGWTSHTDRYRHDPIYQAACLAKNPPIPKWFTLSSGVPCNLVDTSEIDMPEQAKGKGKGTGRGWA